MSDRGTCPEGWREFFLELLAGGAPDLPFGNNLIASERILHDALRHDVLGRIYQNLTKLPPGTVTEQGIECLRNAFAAQALRSLQLANESRHVTTLLASGGIPVIPYKGPSLAERYYFDPLQRSCNDIDLLVPRERLPEAVGLLQKAGYRASSAALQDLRWPMLKSCDNQVALVTPETGILVEIHWEIFKPWRKIPFALKHYWQSLCKKSGDEAVGRLDDEDLLLVICAHALNHYWEKLKWLVDLDCLVRACPHLDWERIFSTARRCGLLRALTVGLSLARKVLATPVPEPFAERLQSDRISGKVVQICVECWFAERGIDRSRYWKIGFLLRSRERQTDKLRMTVSYPIYLLTMQRLKARAGHSPPG